MKEKHRSNKVWTTLIPIYIITIIFVLFPLVYIVLFSFLSRGEVWGVEWKFTLDNYKRIFEKDTLNIFAQSFRLALISTLFVTLTGYPFGYFMAKLSQNAKKRMMQLIMLPFWVSSLIRLYSWIIVFGSNGTLDKLLMGLHITEKPLKLLFSYPAVIFGMIYALFPFMALAVYSSAEKMDWSLVEAARDMGASRFQAFYTITLRLTMPGLLSGIILTFVPSMGLFYVADLFGGSKVLLVGRLIQEQSARGRNLPFAAALSVVLMALTSLMIGLYRRIANTKDLEGLV